MSSAHVCEIYKQKEEKENIFYFRFYYLVFSLGLSKT